MGFVVNSMRFPAVQKFWESVKIWQSYRQFKSGNFFLRQCTLTLWTVRTTHSYKFVFKNSRLNSVEQVVKVIWQKAAHDRFNRIRQVAPICTPIGIRTKPVLSRFEYIDRGHVRAYRPSVILVKKSNLIVLRLKRVKVRHCNKFHSDSVKRCWVMTI